MENIFNLKRFWLLVRRHANDNWKIFLIFLIIMTLPAFYMYINNITIEKEQLSMLYIFALVLVGGFYTCSFFQDWTNSVRATSFLTLPATTIEKFALVLFYSVILFIPVFTLVFYGSNYALLQILNFEMPFKIHLGNQEDTSILVVVLISYPLCQSLFLLSSIWLKKMQFVIAMAVIVILFNIFYFWNSYYIRSMIGGTMLIFDVPSLFPTAVRYSGPGDNYFSITSPIFTTVSRILYVITALFFYLASYYKLKEKEI